MRALVCNRYGPADQLEIEQRPDPQPAADEVLVDIRAAGLNFPDILAVQGQYQVKTPPPFVPGNEAAGVVAAVGSAVTRFRPGDAVMVLPERGAFAEKCVVREPFVSPIPAGLTFEQAAGFTITYATSYHALKQSARLSAGETLLVLGAAGGVGIAAVEIGKAMGARVIAAASSSEKLDFAGAAGADELINYGQAGGYSQSGLKDEVRRLTDGNGADVVYDPVGGELAQQALRSLAWHGRYLVVGFAAGDIPAFPANLALLKEASIIGVFWGAWSQRTVHESAENMRELAFWVEQGKLQPRVTASYPLESYAQAFAEISGRKVRGKIVLTMNDRH